MLASVAFDGGGDDELVFVASFDPSAVMRDVLGEWR